MTSSSSHGGEEAEIIALKALGFLASDSERLQRFVDLTGLSLQAIRQSASEPAFLGGVLDHVLADQTLLLLFAEAAELDPGAVERSRRQLPGARHDC